LQLKILGFMLMVSSNTDGISKCNNAVDWFQNGDVLRQLATHEAAVECLYWAQEGQESVVCIEGLLEAKDAQTYLIFLD